MTTRQQRIPADLDPADYSVCGLEHVVAIERKSLSDLLGCIGQRRRWREARALVGRTIETKP